MKENRSDYASVMVSECLVIDQGEEVAIFSDRWKMGFAEEISGAVYAAGGEVTVFYVPEAVRPVEEVTDLQAAALTSADVVIYVLEAGSEDIDRSREVAFRHQLIAIPEGHKGRVCMMPGFTEDMKGAVMIDYPRLRDRCSNLSEILQDRTVRLTTSLGTDVSFSLLGRKFILDAGDISRPGTHGNIPAGEIYTAPVEESMNGRLVIDGSVGSLGMTDRPFVLVVKAGEITEMYPLAGPSATLEKFQEISDFDVPATLTVGEFGIGTNPGAHLLGNMLIDEKVMGTVHFAFGDSYGLGRSSSRYHTDLLITNPSIYVDGRAVMEAGKFTMDL